MLQVYQDYHAQNPQHSTPPIPSRIIQLPVPAAVVENLCYSSRYLDSMPAVAADDLHATVLTLLHAAHLLESDQNAQQIQDSNQVVGTGHVRKYFLKRNLAGECALCITTCCTLTCLPYLLTHCQEMLQQ